MDPEEERHIEAIQDWVARYFAGEAEPDEWPTDAAWSLLSKANSLDAEALKQKAFERRIIQTFDLAEAINEGTTGAYIQRWYPSVTAPTITIIRLDERILFDSFDDNRVGWARIGNQATIWRFVAAFVGGACQTCAKVERYLSTWYEGCRRVGYRPSV